jgi:hypothetical protein
MPLEVRRLIRTMSLANPLGAHRGCIGEQEATTVSGLEDVSPQSR